MKDVAQLLNDMIALPSQKGLDILKPIYEFCANSGWYREGEAVRVGDWPVQFIPAFNPLTEEAMRQAYTAEIQGVPIRVVRADYLAAIALSVGRAKDFARILALLESNAVTPDEIEKLAIRLGLQPEWSAFRKKFLDE